MEKELTNIPLLHIAGTKGKGTTAAFAESILRHRGLKTALFTSPHLVSVCERYFLNLVVNRIRIRSKTIFFSSRIRINGQPIQEDIFAEYFDDIFDEIVKYKETTPCPAYFSFLTFVALRAFIKEV